MVVACELRLCRVCDSRTSVYLCASVIGLSDISRSVLILLTVVRVDGMWSGVAGQLTCCLPRKRFGSWFVLCFCGLFLLLCAFGCPMWANLYL